ERFDIVALKSNNHALTQRGEARRRRSNRRAHEWELRRDSTTGETRRYERPAPSPAWTDRETWRATAATTTRGTPLGSCELRRLRRIPRRGRPCSDRVPFLGRPAIRRSRPLPVAGRDRQPPRLLDPDSR